MFSFDQGSSNLIEVEGTLFLRLKAPKRYMKKIQSRNKADFFSFGDEYEQAMMRVIQGMTEDENLPQNQDA